MFATSHKGSPPTSMLAVKRVDAQYFEFAPHGIHDPQQSDLDLGLEDASLLEWINTLR